MSKTASSTKKGIAAKSAKPSAHPSWFDMIKECIIAHPGDSRLGVSRPTIKKFVESKYRIPMDAFHTSQLSRAIVSGSEKGSFVLPKGPSGKVKLAPKAKVDAAKEFSKAEKENKKATKLEPAERKPSTTKKTLTASMSENKKPASAKGTKAQVSKKSVAKGESKTLPKTPIARPARKPAAAKTKPTAKKTTTKKSAAKKTAAKTAASAPKARGRVTPRTAASGKKSAPTTKSTKSTRPSSATAKSTSKA